MLTIYFSSVFTNEDTSHILSMECDPLNAIQVHSEGFAKLFSNIDPSKSHGPDNLPSGFLNSEKKRSALRLHLLLHGYSRHL